MERLSDRWMYYSGLLAVHGVGVGDLKHIQNLIDAEEQGLLLRLPCKAGDTVWIKGDRFPAEVAEISLDEEGLFFKYVEYDRGHEITEVWDSGFFYADDIGKTVFLTKAEAEKALAEMG